jgi:DNA invertase Pin-like site-specific DNA recombinase
MIYGYLRVSTDEQDINSQRQGVNAFAEKNGWSIEKYITDEGVSGGKDPSKRNLGGLLNSLKKGDVVIASEISRLGRDLYMVMDILHFCMEREVVIYTVKDNFTLGKDIQSKVLAFAFGLAAEIERQMIQQRTREGLKLRMKMGILLGRPLSANTELKCIIPEAVLRDKEKILSAVEFGASFANIAKKYGVNKDSVRRWCKSWGCELTQYDEKKRLEAARRRRELLKQIKYKENDFCVVDLPRDQVREMIEADKTIPQIHEQLQQFTYEQIYDSILNDVEFNNLYRQHAQKKLKKVKI